MTFNLKRLRMALSIDRRELMFALSRSGKLTPELSLFIRSRDDFDIRNKIKEGKYNKAVRLAANLPVLKRSQDIATSQEIKRYLELHCSLLDIEYTGYELVDKETATYAKLDRQWENEIAAKPMNTVWFEIDLPLKIARLCSAAMEDDRYAPLYSLIERNIWVYGPDRQTFTWYVYDALGENINLPD